MMNATALATEANDATGSELSADSTRREIESWLAEHSPVELVALEDGAPHDVDDLWANVDFVLGTL